MNIPHIPVVAISPQRLGRHLAAPQTANKTATRLLYNTFDAESAQTAQVSSRSDIGKLN
jgi:hypothetical protein